MSSVARLLERAIPGAPKSLAVHIKRGKRIAEAIQEHFAVAEPRQWQAKHLRWVLERWTGNMAPPTRYDYWLTSMKLASALDHWPDWEPHLRGPWATIKSKDGKNMGGRPAKLAASSQRKAVHKAGSV